MHIRLSRYNDSRNLFCYILNWVKFSWLMHQHTIRAGPRNEVEYSEWSCSTTRLSDCHTLNTHRNFPILFHWTLGIKMGHNLILTSATAACSSLLTKYWTSSRTRVMTTGFSSSRSASCDALESLVMRNSPSRIRMILRDIIVEFFANWRVSFARTKSILLGGLTLTHPRFHSWG